MLKLKFVSLFACIFMLGIPFVGTGQVTYVNLNSNQAAKLIANAGSDTTVCRVDTVLLGGSPSAIGGTAAYTYNWTTTGNISSTTVANPTANASATTKYKLTVTDNENCTSMDSMTLTVTWCTSVAEWTIPVDVQVTPNPNNGTFKVTLQGNYNHAQLHLKLRNVLGEIIQSRKLGSVTGSKTEIINLTKEGAGVYFLDITNGADHSITKIIVR